ncbi:hypothetical protein EX30DRAFT_349852 [Ascodesmis nigricans]|uniref:Myb/SANT-like domain-containing protein n=1 Tax=Ascodesmis nigricans TaxID=341454 RepID=A0A4S2MTR9_9PEZI|nr:hypothetical protein EX30DRAFT_349852 [Ascodesmis nigricans]
MTQKRNVPYSTSEIEMMFKLKEEFHGQVNDVWAFIRDKLYEAFGANRTTSGIRTKYYTQNTYGQQIFKLSTLTFSFFPLLTHSFPAIIIDDLELQAFLETFTDTPKIPTDDLLDTDFTSDSIFQDYNWPRLSLDSSSPPEQTNTASDIPFSVTSANSPNLFDEDSSHSSTMEDTHQLEQIVGKIERRVVLYIQSVADSTKQFRSRSRSTSSAREIPGVRDGRVCKRGRQ